MSFKAENSNRKALGFADSVLMSTDTPVATGETMLSELGVTLPKDTDKLTVTINALLFADGLSKDGDSISFTAATPERLERDKQETADTEKREGERIKNVLAQCEHDLKLVTAELELSKKGVDLPLLVSLGLADAFAKPLSRLENIEEALKSITDSNEARELQKECSALREEYTEESKKAAPKRKKRLAVSICSLSVVIAILTAVLVPTVVIPTAKLKKAIAMKEDGKLVEAYYALKEMDGAKAAAEKGIVGEWAPTLKEALALARAKGNLVVTCGSLYLYADLF